MLEDGDIGPTAYGLLNYLGQAGADRQEEGFATTYDFLARLFDVSEKTITRHLECLRDLGELDYKVGRGQNLVWAQYLQLARVAIREPLHRGDGIAREDPTGVVLSPSRHLGR
jgi:hypothetical protein